jgi:hypothetical protein
MEYSPRALIFQHMLRQGERDAAGGQRSTPIPLTGKMMLSLTGIVVLPRITENKTPENVK